MRTSLLFTGGFRGLNPRLISVTPLLGSSKNEMRPSIRNIPYPVAASWSLLYIAALCDYGVLLEVMSADGKNEEKEVVDPMNDSADTISTAMAENNEQEGFEGIDLE